MKINSAVDKRMDSIAVEIGTKACRALLEEVYTTPKPGLVDRYSCGAHTDMNLDTFEASSQALWPFFVMMAEQGLRIDSSDDELFQHIRITGMIAEKAMFQATGNVNTHRGLIFSIGVYCAAAGRCMQRYGMITETNLREIQQNMTTRILKDELERIHAKGLEEAESNGEKNLKKYGTSGIRGEAIDGYPSVWNVALPVLRQGIRENRDYNLVKLQTLFALMSQVEDSNILARKDMETLKQIHALAAEFLESGGAYVTDAYRKLTQLDETFSRQGISPGGCADLLAAAIFLNMLLEEQT